VQVRFFTVPVHGGGDAAAELNQFLSGHRILSIDRHLVADAANSAWAVCVSFDQISVTQSVPARGTMRGDKVDYKEVLTAPQFAVFARLRALRKELADKEGVPAYALFTNDQMAQIIQRDVADLSGFRGIQGVGDARVEKYGEAFLAVLREAALPTTADAP
jgi:superfamily II DNA helicase RecQ